MRTCYFRLKRGRVVFGFLVFATLYCPPLSASAALSPARMDLMPLGSKGQLLQQIDVEGRVTDGSGAPLTGVTISLKGTSRGTSSDVNGRFSIKNVPADGVLVFSYVGFKTSEIAIGGKTVLNVKLQASQTELNQLVVVGYGREKKVNLTGAISTISSKEIERRPNVSVSNALQGLAAGVTVTSQTGAPGGDKAEIHIRGINSFGGSSSDPLVMIDGVAGSINDIDANEIESISILKDAASAAIYGSRAANGVILITTKRAGGKDHLSVTYKGYVGKQSPTEIPKVTNGLTYMRVYNEANMNDYGSTVYSDQEIADFKAKYEADPDNYDWQKAILKGSGFIQSHFLSLNVNSGIVHVAPSVSYVDQEGIIQNTDFKRYIFRNNMDIIPSDKVKISFDLAVSNADRKQIAHEGDIWNYLGRMPTNIPIRNGDYWSDGWVKINPVGLIADGGDFKSNDLEFKGKLSLNYKPVDWLSLTGMIAPRYLTSNDHHFTRSVMTYLEDGSEAGAAYTYSDLTESGYRSLYGTFQFLADAHKSFNKHNFSLMVGTSRETFDQKYLSGYRRDYVYPNYEQLAAGADDVTKDNNGTESQWLLVSGFGRFMYNYQEKYLFEANLRYDGSSRFLGDNRWAAFPSFSAGWIISKEPFMQEVTPVLNFLKLRGSWGKLGNQNIGSSYYPFSEPLSIGSVSMGGVIYPKVSQTRLSNPDLHWESTTMSGVGVDASLFDNFSFSFDWYSKKTDGILLLLNVSELIGLAPPYQNAGIVSNKGWDFSAQYNKDWGDFHLGVGVNFSDVSNKIINMKGQTFGSLLRQQEGYAINSIYGYVSQGLYQSQDEIDHGPEQIGTLQPGDIRYKDMNGDNKITDADEVIIGNTIPRYTYSGKIDLGWKGLRLNLFLQGVQKVDGYLNAQYVIPLSNSSSVKPWQLDYWSEQNKDASLPRVSITSANNVQNSSFWMRDAAYLRLKNIQLGYDIPQTLVTKLGLESAFVYLNGQNIFTETNFYQGYDPEINYNASSADGVTLGNGGFYPQVKTFSFGVDLKF